jgi:hypothetical protein
LWATGNSTSAASGRGRSVDTTMTESESSDAGLLERQVVVMK